MLVVVLTGFANIIDGYVDKKLRFMSNVLVSLNKEGLITMTKVGRRWAITKLGEDKLRLQI